jgi:hypothetical protein
MKTILIKIGNFFIAWSAALNEYRNRKGYRDGGFY